MKRGFVSAAIVLVTGFFASVISMELATTLAQNVYYGDNLYWKDVTKQGKWWYTCDVDDITRGDSTVTVPLDSNNYPIEVPYQTRGVAMHMLVSVWEGVYPFGEFTLEFEGTGEIKLAGPHTATITNAGGRKTYTFTISKSDVAFSNKSARKRNPTSDTQLRLGITRSDKADPIRNVHMLLPGYGESYSDAQPFADEFVSRLRYSPYTVVRMMNIQNVNFSTESAWSDRTLPGSIIQTGGFEGKYPHGVALEHLITLCNVTGKNMWLNVPVMANDAYLDKMAKLIADNLDPGLKVWFEYGNEVWNAMFVGYRYACDEGRRLGLGPVDKAIQNNNYFYTYMTVKAGEALEKHLGSSRVIPVISGWANGPRWSELRILALSDPNVNPNDYQVKHFATTTYFGSPTSVDQGMAPAGNWGVHMELCKTHNMTYVSYEGGHGGGMPKNQLYGAYTYALDQFSTFLGLYNEFLFSNIWGSHTYGALEYITQPLEEAPKYRAIVDWASENNGYTVDISRQFEAGKAGSHSGRTPRAYTGGVYDLQGRIVAPSANDEVKRTSLTAHGMFIHRDNGTCIRMLNR